MLIATRLYVFERSTECILFEYSSDTSVWKTSPFYCVLATNMELENMAVATAMEMDVHVAIGGAPTAKLQKVQDDNFSPTTTPGDSTDGSPDIGSSDMEHDDDDDAKDPLSTAVLGILKSKEVLELALESEIMNVAQNMRTTQAGAMEGLQLAQGFTWNKAKANDCVTSMLALARALPRLTLRNQIQKSGDKIGVPAVDWLSSNVCGEKAMVLTAKQPFNDVAKRKELLEQCTQMYKNSAYAHVMSVQPAFLRKDGTRARDPPGAMAEALFTRFKGAQDAKFSKLANPNAAFAQWSVDMPQLVLNNTDVLFAAIHEHLVHPNLVNILLPEIVNQLRAIFAKTVVIYTKPSQDHEKDDKLTECLSGLLHELNEGYEKERTFLQNLIPKILDKAIALREKDQTQNQMANNGGLDWWQRTLPERDDGIVQKRRKLGTDDDAFACIFSNMAAASGDASNAVLNGVLCPWSGSGTISGAWVTHSPVGESLELGLAAPSAKKQRLDELVAYIRDGTTSYGSSLVDAEKTRALADRATAVTVREVRSAVGAPAGVCQITDLNTIKTFESLRKAIDDLGPAQEAETNQLLRVLESSAANLFGDVSGSSCSADAHNGSRDEHQLGALRKTRTPSVAETGKKRNGARPCINTANFLLANKDCLQNLVMELWLGIFDYHGSQSEESDKRRKHIKNQVEKITGQMAAKFVESYGEIGLAERQTLPDYLTTFLRDPQREHEASDMIMETVAGDLRAFARTTLDRATKIGLFRTDTGCVARNVYGSVQIALADGVEREAVTRRDEELEKQRLLTASPVTQAELVRKISTFGSVDHMARRAKQYYVDQNKADGTLKAGGWLSKRNGPCD